MCIYREKFRVQNITNPHVWFKVYSDVIIAQVALYVIPTYAYGDNDEEKPRKAFIAHTLSTLQ